MKTDTDRLASALSAAKRISREREEAAALKLATINAARQANLERKEAERRGALITGLVYYVGNGNGRVKIGWTTNLTQRMRDFRVSIPEASVLGFEIGTIDTERLRHGQFMQERVKREWFSISERLQEWMGLLNTDFALGQIT